MGSDSPKAGRSPRNTASKKSSSHSGQQKKPGASTRRKTSTGKSSTTKKTNAPKKTNTAKNGSSVKKTPANEVIRAPVRRSTSAKSSTASTRKKKAASKRNTQASRRHTRPSAFKRLLKWFGYFTVTGFVALVIILIYLDARVTQTFEGKRWAIPAKIYARPLELFEGRPLKSQALVQELKQLGYEAVSYPKRPGQYSTYKGKFHIYSRPFLFWDGLQNEQLMTLQLRGNRIQSLSSSNEQDMVRLEPIRVGGIYPNHNEDRELISLDDAPELLLKGLIAVEDRQFYEHWGISVRGIARAMLANVKAGGLVQGGSTLTQQLVKNMYLNHERTLSRKAVEALMAVLLEVNYPKESILETYMNEIYLGQSGRRAIHGFGLGSQFYFQRNLPYLQTHEIALLVGIIKGPSYYNPHRFPERAKKRRDQVLDIWQEAGLIDQAQWLKAKSAALGVTKKAPYLNVEYPAYLDLVKRQLKADYREADLTSEGLRIFTSLDPFTQRQAEEQLSKEVKRLESRYKQKPGTFESASVITDAFSGDVLAVVGSRSPRFFGFNRALDARRPIGSLVKPVVFLTALSQPERYHLGSILEDERYEHLGKNGKLWVPQNYDRRSHGRVSLQDVLAHSYNQATVRLGMEIGVKNVVNTLNELGLVREVAPFPAVLLGAVSLTPYEVASLYQTIASGGYLMPLRAIRAVTTADGAELNRYGIKLNSALDRGSVYLIQRAMQRTVEQGSGRFAHQQLPQLKLAGKTGTTNDQRDSWFAGFSGDKVAVVWVGRDDNGVTPLTGSSGALKIWTSVMREIAVAPLMLNAPRDIESVAYDPEAGTLYDSQCGDLPTLPVRKDSLVAAEPCPDNRESDWADNIRSWFSDF